MNFKGCLMQRRTRIGALAMGTFLMLNGCSTVQVSHYAAERPLLDLRGYFNGTLDAYGVFTDRGGTVVKRFSVVMECHWEGNEGVLDESFTYSDGSKQRRVWRLTAQPDGRFTGRADDVRGEARGQQSGNAFNWTYTLALPVGEGIYDVQLDDWMYLMDERVMLNRTSMSKWGVHLGDITLSFAKRQR
jgi:hypothetical protein